MYIPPELQDYLDEIRMQACSRCIERPPGGPPCAPLGRKCAVEQDLPLLVKAVHEVNSPLIEPYLDNIHWRLWRDSCPLDSLLVHIVQAIQTVDRRRQDETTSEAWDEWQDLGGGD